MIKSMTGYGKSRQELNGKVYQFEVRSVNSKTLDLNLKLPAEYRELEPALRALASSVIGRGKVDFTLSQVQKPQNGETPLFHLNIGQIETYWKELAQAGMPIGQDISGLLHLPGVVCEEQLLEVSENDKAALLSAAEECLHQLDASRIQEGEVMKADLLLRVGNIERFAKETDAFEQERVPAIRRRMEQHLAELGKEVETDRNRLEQEMIYYLEKLDVTEEKVRLAKHCRYYRDTLDEEAAGRKLAFIAQEMGREINTLGSKSNHAEMQKTVVRMKDELEKIKEQLFNIL